VTLYQKVDFFNYIFWAASPPPAPIEVKFCTANETLCALAVPNLTWIGATSRPCGAKNLIFGLRVNLIPAVCTYSRRALYDLPQTLHFDRARRGHQKRVIYFSIQRIVFLQGARKKIDLIDRRAVSQQSCGPHSHPCADWGEILLSQADPGALLSLTWIGATSRPWRAKNLIIGLWVNFSILLHYNLHVLITLYDLYFFVSGHCVQNVMTVACRPEVLRCVHFWGKQLGETISTDYCP